MHHVDTILDSVQAAAHQEVPRLVQRDALCVRGGDDAREAVQCERLHAAAICDLHAEGLWNQLGLGSA